MTLTIKDLRLARLFSAAVLGNWEELRRLRRAAPAGEPDRAWREAILPVHIFAGFPRLVETFGVLAEEGGLGQAQPDELEDLAPPAFAARGQKLFDLIYGDQSERVGALLESYHTDFATWITSHAYGGVLSRDGLEGAQRELLACCALAALGQERQFQSHARGSLRLGASLDDLATTLTTVADLLPPENLIRAQAIIAGLN